MAWKWVGVGVVLSGNGKAAGCELECERRGIGRAVERDGEDVEMGGSVKGAYPGTVEDDREREGEADGGCSSSASSSTSFPSPFGPPPISHLFHPTDSDTSEEESMLRTEAAPESMLLDRPFRRELVLAMEGAGTEMEGGLGDSGDEGRGTAAERGVTKLENILEDSDFGLVPPFGRPPSARLSSASAEEGAPVSDGVEAESRELEVEIADVNFAVRDVAA